MSDLALFDPKRHEAVTDRPWDAGVARAAIHAIVDDARAAYTPETLWPGHQNDAPLEADPFCCLYFGAAGIIWALDYLARVGACDDRNPRMDAERVLTINRKMMGAEEPRLQSLLMGDAGIWLTQWRQEKSPAVADALFEAVARNADHPAQEFMWGAPGTMAAALAMHEETGEQRWIDAYRASAAALEQSFLPDEENGYRLWTQDLYGNRAKMIGAVHGFAGNAYALIKGRRFLDGAQWSPLSRAIAETVAGAAMRNEDGVNWPPTIGPSRPGREKVLIQHCHGAPGMVVCLAELDQPIDDLLLGAGEITWRAGPLRKGANLCHGTSGNGYAFLKLFARTGDQKWLDRARAFAMHAIARSAADRAEFGMGRYSLWTGDLGLAIYLWDCLNAQARFPTMDVF